MHNAPIVSQYQASEQSLALLEAANGDALTALSLANKALTEAEKFNDQPAHTDTQALILAKAWSTLSVTQAKVGMAEQARQSATKAMQLWDAIKKPSLLIPYRQTMADTQALLNPPHLQ